MGVEGVLPSGRGAIGCQSGGESARVLPRVLPRTSPPPRPPAHKPLPASSRTARSAEPGPGSGPSAHTTDRPHTRCGSPVPDRRPSASSGMTKGEVGAKTHTPGGYWIPAFAGMTAVGVAAPIRLTPAEGANGSRLSGFASGRDDLRGGGKASHPFCRHAGQGAAATRCPLAARAAARTHRRGAHPLFARHPARKPLLASSRTARQRRAGIGEPGRMRCAPERCQDRRGSPVPGRGYAWPE